MKKLIWTTLLVAAAALLAGSVYAQDTGIYAGAKLGGYTVDVDSLEFDDFAWGVYGGYMFNPYIGIEIEYLSLEEGSDGGIDAEADVWIASAKPTLPIGDTFELFAKLGWGYTDVEVSGFGLSESDSDDSFFGGIGAEWHGERLSVRGELQFDDDVPDTLVYTVGLGYAF